MKQNNKLIIFFTLGMLFLFIGTIFAQRHMENLDRGVVRVYQGNGNYISWRMLGTDPSNDKEIFHEKDNTFSTYASKSKSRKYIFIGSYSTLSTEMRFLDADDPDGNFRIIHPRERDHEYSVSHFGNRFYIVTNYKAKNFRLMETGITRTGKNYWKKVIPHRNDVLLEGIDIFKPTKPNTPGYIYRNTNGGIVKNGNLLLVIAPQIGELFFHELSEPNVQTNPFAE